MSLKFKEPPCRGRKWSKAENLKQVESNFLKEKNVLAVPHYLYNCMLVNASCKAALVM